MIAERQKGHTYYRCHFVGCRGNSIREEHLDAAVHTALNTVQLPPDVERLLHARVQTWMAKGSSKERLRAAAMQLSAVDERLEKLEDAAIEQIIDKQSFMARKEKLLIERARLVEARDNLHQSQHDPDRIRNFLERLKNLAIHYENAGRQEKREIIEIAFSNRTVACKTVSIEPSNWLASSHEAVEGLGCAHVRARSRTFGPTQGRGTPDQHLENLAHLARAPESRHLFGWLRPGFHKGNHGPRSDQPKQPGL